MAFDLLKRQTGILADPLRFSKVVRRELSAFPMQAIAPDTFKGQAEQLPSMIDVSKCTGEQLVWLLGMLQTVDTAPSDQFPFVALFETHATGFAPLIQHHKRRVAPHLPRNERGIFLYYDPQVWVHLQWMLTPEQLGALLGPVAAWIVPLGGKWQCTTSKEPPTGYSIHLPAAQWQRIERIGTINAVLDKLPDATHELAEEEGGRIEALLIRAEGYGLTDREDKICFAECGINRHPAFDSHERIAAILAESANHPARFRRRIAQLTSADWQAIVDDLNHPMHDRGQASSRVAKSAMTQSFGAAHD